MKHALVSFILAFSWQFAQSAPAPAILNHQGRIAVGNVNHDGPGHFKFALVDEAAGETYWTNDGTSTGTPGGEPTAAITIAVTKGHYNLGLGDTATANMTALPASVFAENTNVFLRSWFSTDNTTFHLLTPDRRVAAAAYAFSAEKAQGVADQAITSAMLADGAVGAPQLGSGAVTSGKIAAGAVGSSEIADGTITLNDVSTSVDYLLRSTITHPDPVTSAHFGCSVAAVGTDKLLVGADGDDTGATNAGSTHLLDLKGNLLITINNPNPADDDHFGCAVAAVGTDKLLVGADGDDTGATNAGSAYLFDLSGNLLATINNPQPTADDHFGSSLAAVGTDKLLVGAHFDDNGATNAGSAYLFDLSGNLLATINNPSPAADDHFGSSLTAVGTDKLLIGAWRDDTSATDAGSAYLFDLGSNLLATIHNPNPAIGDQFGFSVAAVGTDKLLVGADGDDIGATNAGSAYLFDLSGNRLATINNPEPIVNDFFGCSVTGVGLNKLLIGACRNDTGAMDAGSAYLFDLSGKLLATIRNPNPAIGDYFGFAAAGVGADKVLIGAHFDDTGATDAGSTYLFDLQNYIPGLVADGVRGGNSHHAHDAMTLEEIRALPIQSSPAIIQATDTGDDYIIRAGEAGSAARRVILADSSENITTGDIENSGQLGDGGNVYLPRFRYLGFLDENGELGAGWYFWPGHSGGDEVVGASPRWAWYWTDGWQMGSPATARDNRYIYIQPNKATASDSIVESPPMAFFGRYWDGAANQDQKVWLYTIPQSQAADSEKLFVNFGGSNPVNDHRIDDGVIGATFTRQGMDHAGRTLAFTTLTDGPTITHTLEPYREVQSAKVTLGGNRTLAFAGLTAGMRGVLYVRQDGTGSRTLALPSGSATAAGFALSTAPDAYDRLAWEYDGAHLFWTIDKGIILP